MQFHVLELIMGYAQLPLLAAMCAVSHKCKHHIELKALGGRSLLFCAQREWHTRLSCCTVTSNTTHHNPRVITVEAAGGGCSTLRWSDVHQPSVAMCARSVAIRLPFHCVQASGHGEHVWARSASGKLCMVSAPSWCCVYVVLPAVCVMVAALPCARAIAVMEGGGATSVTVTNGTAHTQQLHLVCASSGVHLCVSQIQHRGALMAIHGAGGQVYTAPAAGVTTHTTGPRRFLMCTPLHHPACGALIIHDSIFMHQADSHDWARFMLHHTGKLARSTFSVHGNVPVPGDISAVSFWTHGTSCSALMLTLDGRVHVLYRRCGGGWCCESVPLSHGRLAVCITGMLVTDQTGSVMRVSVEQSTVSGLCSGVLLVPRPARNVQCVTTGSWSHSRCPRLVAM